MSTPSKPVTSVTTSKPVTTSVTTSVPMGAAAVPIQDPKVSGKAIASMVCGILGLLMFGIIFGPIAIGLGVSAKNDIKQNPQEIQGKCQATAGIVCGVIAIILWAIVLAIYLGGSS